MHTKILWSGEEPPSAQSVRAEMTAAQRAEQRVIDWVSLLLIVGAVAGMLWAVQTQIGG